MSDKSNNLIEFKFVFLIIFTVALTLASFLFSEIEVDDLNKDNFGMFGDYFGGILTPFLTFLTLIYLIKSINQQSKVIELTSQQLVNSANELELSRKEMELTRGELSASANAQKKQAELFESQNEQSRRTDTILNTTKMFEDLSNLFEKDLDKVIYLLKVQKNNIIYFSTSSSTSLMIDGKLESCDNTKKARFFDLNHKYMKEIGDEYSCKYSWSVKNFYETKLELLIQMHYCLNTLISLRDIRKALFYVGKVKQYVHQVKFEDDCPNLLLLKRLTQEAEGEIISEEIELIVDDIRTPLVERIQTHINDLYFYTKQ